MSSPKIPSRAPNLARTPPRTGAQGPKAAKKKSTEKAKELTEEQMSEEAMDTGDDDDSKRRLERLAEQYHQPTTANNRDKYAPKEGDAHGGKAASAPVLAGPNSPVNKSTTSAPGGALEAKPSAGGSAPPQQAAGASGTAGTSATHAPTQQSVSLGTSQASLDKAAAKPDAAPKQSLQEQLEADFKAKSTKRASEMSAATETQKSTGASPVKVRSSMTPEQANAKRAATGMTLPPKRADARTMLASSKPAGSSLADYVPASPEAAAAAESAESSARQSISNLKSSGKLRPDVDVQVKMRETGKGPFLVLEPNSRLKMDEFNRLPMKVDDFRTLVVLDFNKPLKRL